VRQPFNCNNLALAAACAALDDHEFDIARRVVPTLWQNRPRDEWVRLLQEHDVAAVPVLRPGEIVRHEQVEHADLVVAIPDRDYGTVQQLRPGVRFSLTPPGDPQPAPTVGEHDDLLPELLARPVATHGNQRSIT
ncbi:MAG TPA: CoA transferase, partial [Ilumatobacteraceae bacterium]|nr:CoA transferase [Ilumatobacteraceae bacterium]